MVVFVDYLLWGAVVLLGLYGDRDTVLVRTANKTDIFTTHSEITAVNIGRNVNSCQMPDMNRSVCVGQCCCHKMSFVFAIHMNVCYIVTIGYFYEATKLQKMLNGQPFELLGKGVADVHQYLNLFHQFVLYLCVTGFFGIGQFVTYLLVSNCGNLGLIY